MFKRSVPLAALVSFAMLLAAAPASAQPFIEAAPAQLEYGAVDLHFGGNPQQNVKFTNNTPGTLHVTAAELSGADPSSFLIVNDGCTGNFVGAGENCSLEVVFKPTARGVYAATLVLLTLDESAGEVSAELPISASASPGTPSPSPSELTFSPIPYNPPESFEGENNESQSLSIQNSSDFGTQLQSVSITGPDAADFTVEWGNCENNLMGPNNSCGMGIRFRPSATGLRTASLVVQSDSAAGPIVIPLSGQGLHGPQMTLDTTQALLGSVALGHSAQHTFTVTNTGDYLLYIQRSDGRLPADDARREERGDAVHHEHPRDQRRRDRRHRRTGRRRSRPVAVDAAREHARAERAHPGARAGGGEHARRRPGADAAAGALGRARAAPLQPARPCHARPRRRRAVPRRRQGLRNAELRRAGRHDARLCQRLRPDPCRARLRHGPPAQRPGRPRAHPAHAPRTDAAEAARAYAGACRRRRARRRRDRRAAQLDDEAERRRRRLAALSRARPSGRRPGRPLGAHAGLPRARR